MTRKKRALEILVYVVFLATVCESLTRFAFSVPRFTNRLPVTEEDWWRQSWLQRHRDTGKDIYYDFDLFDPTKGWVAKPNLRDRVAFDQKVLNTNSRGLRGNREYAYGKLDRPRVLVFGDSFTFGDEVSDDETYCHTLQLLLPHVEVINMGVHGYGHDQMLILFQEEGVKYEPDVVVLGFVTMDMPRNVLAFRDYAKPKFVVAGGTLKLTGTPVPSPEELLARKRPRSRALELFAAVWERVRKKTGLYDRAVEKTTTAILDEFAATSERIGATPVFVFLPTEKEMTGERSTEGEEYLLSLCDSRPGLKCVSTRAAFDAGGPEGAVFMRGGHWPPSGHRIVAKALASYLVGEGLVPAPPE